MAHNQRGIDGNTGDTGDTGDGRLCGDNGYEYARGTCDWWCGNA